MFFGFLPAALFVLEEGRRGLRRRDITARGAVSRDAAPDGQTFCALLLTDELCRMNMV